MLVHLFHIFLITRSLIDVNVKLWVQGLQASVDSLLLRHCHTTLYHIVGNPFPINQHHDYLGTLQTSLFVRPVRQRGELL